MEVEKVTINKRGEKMSLDSLGTHLLFVLQKILGENAPLDDYESMVKKGLFFLKKGAEKENIDHEKRFGYQEVAIVENFWACSDIGYCEEIDLLIEIMEKIIQGTKITVWESEIIFDFWDLLYKSNKQYLPCH